MSAIIRNSPYPKKIITALIGVGLILFFVNRIFLGIALFGLAAAAMFLPVISKDRCQGLTRRDWLLISMAMGFPVLYLVRMVLSDFDFRLLDRVSRILLIIPVYLVVRCFGISIKTIFLSCAFGVFFAGIDAFFQILQGQTRVRGMSVNNSIPFGNFSLLFGFISFLSVYWLQEDRARPYIFFLATMSLATGIFVSFASGSRGGWIAIPIFLAILGFAGKKGFPLWRYTSLLTMLLLAVLFVPSINGRVAQGVADVNAYLAHQGPWTQGDAISSLDSRLDMWAAGLAGFKSSPFMGLGFGDEYKEFLKNRVDLGLSHPTIFSHRHLHSEIITTAARLGLVGIASLLILLVGGLRWFTSGPMRKDGEAKIISSLGLMVIASMIIFPMTDSMFGTTLHPMLYAALIGLAAGALRHHELSTKAELPGVG